MPALQGNRHLPAMRRYRTAPAAEREAVYFLLPARQRQMSELPGIRRFRPYRRTVFTGGCCSPVRTPSAGRGAGTQAGGPAEGRTEAQAEARSKSQARGQAGQGTGQEGCREETGREEAGQDQEIGDLRTGDAVGTFRACGGAVVQPVCRMGLSGNWMLKTAARFSLL